MELGLRHVFGHCDGGNGTSGPDSFTGSLGQALMTEVHQMKVVQFQTVATPLAYIDEEVQKDLSRDQLLLYQYTKAISTGTVTKKLEQQDLLITLDG